MRIFRHPEYHWVTAILFDPWSSDSGKRMLTLRCERCHLNQTMLVKVRGPAVSWLDMGFVGDKFAKEHRFC